MTVPNATQCPADAVLTEFGLGKLDAGSAETVSRHIETCADCRRRVASVSGDSFVGRLRQADAPAPRRERTYVPGESLANAANSTDGSLEDGLPRPSSKSSEAKLGGLVPARRDSVSAPPELANHPDYELIKELGQGGMGTVYLAKNRMMDRMEVLKVISKELLARPGALERFQQEIRSAAKLQHPNIVAAYSVLRPGDLLVFAMEYVKGQDLSQVVKARGYFPVANAAFYIHQVALGLQHAHEKGMVHRDIKPNNLMLAVEGKKHVVKILDFGLAKATSEKAGETGLTKSGQMLGTPDYISPEQSLDAHKADIRADIYSLGCTLYFLLSGHPPFQETSLFEILKAHHERDPRPLNLVRPDVPAELAAVVAKMMAKDFAKRYQIPGEVAKALVPFFKPSQATATQLSDTTQSRLAENTAHGPGAGAVAPVTANLPPRIAIVPPLLGAVQSPAAPTIILTGKSSKAKRRSEPPWIAIAVGAGLLALLLGVIVIVRNRKGEVAKFESKDGASVEIEQIEPTPILTTAEPKDAATSRASRPAQENVNEAAVASPLPPRIDRFTEKGTSGSADELSRIVPPLAVAPFDDLQARAHQLAWAKHLGMSEQTNSIGMKLVLIPPGEFTMGSSAEQFEQRLRVLHSNEQPQHRVRITRPLLAGAAEVTVGQFHHFVDATGFRTEAERDGAGGWGPNPTAPPPYAQRPEFTWRNWGFEQAGGHPVVNVTWNDAVEFCNWLSAHENLPVAYRNGKSGEWISTGGAGYRLPSEAEWEYMCRAGTTTAYSYGDDLDQLPIWWQGKAGGKPCPVFVWQPNSYGLFGMHGNAAEWCQDRFDPNYYLRSPTDDPVGPENDTNTRASRGGSWFTGSYPLRCADRQGFQATFRHPQLGFRVVRSATAASSSNESSFPAGSNSPSGRSVADKLKQITTLSFPRNTLEQSLKLLGDDIGVEVIILGNDLREEGITKNQSFGLDEKEKVAGDILRKILMLSNPDGKLVYVIKPKPGGTEEVLYVTTRAAAKKRGDRLPPELGGAALPVAVPISRS